MKSKKKTTKDRNWGLVFVASLLILIGLALIVVALTNISGLGWWSISIVAGGLTTIGAAIASIVKNDPSWILLDLILPS